MGDFDSVRNFIINNKNYIFEIDISGKAPLAYACAHGRVDIARFIIQQGVNCDHRCSNGRTPLFYALRTRNIGLVRLLLQHGASPWSNSQNPYS